MFRNDTPSRIVRISQVHAQVMGCPSTNPFKRTRDIVLKWAETRSVVLPSEAWQGEPFEINPPGPLLHVITHPNIWAMQFAHGDEQNRYWTTNATIIRHKNQVHIGSTVVCSLPKTALTPARSVPSFYKEINNDMGLSDHGHKLGMLSFASDKNQTDRLLSFLQCKTRTKPVVVISLLDGTNASPIEPSKLAKKLGPLAHVYVITPDMSRHLTIKTAKEWSVYQGAIRTYLSQYDPSTDDPYKHPLETYPEIKSMQQRQPNYMDFVFERCARIGAETPPEQSLPSFSRVKKEITTSRIQKLTATPNRDMQITDGIIDSLQKENQELWNDNDRLESALTGSHKTIESLKAERVSLLSIITGLKRKEKSSQGIDLIQLWKKASPEITRYIPSDLSNLGSWVEEHLTGHLILLPRALQAAKKSTYKDSSLIYKTLLLLACEYRDQFINANGARKAFDQKREALGLAIGKSFNKSPGVKTDAYTVNYGGENKVLEWHLKKGNSQDPSNCFRTYFFFDEETKRPVVGYLPGHLDNRLTT